ncbi:TetR/AcrR family transcriptional regulator [Xanthobacter sp. DSM 24535]|uniref:TetR/AcrR family transcriptional regulator n=1 Tax=Roseixanthobacter psychrophilus TaxID=3119917 RepID=UPI00372C7AD1
MALGVPTLAAVDHRSEQQKRILTAAVQCFARDGFHGTSMQKICAEAGMSPGALYRYFPSKESIIGAIVEGESADRARLFEYLDQAPSLIDGLTECIATLLANDTMDCAKLGPEIMAEAIRNEKLRDALEPVEEESHVLLRAALVSGMEKGEIDPTADPDTLVMLLKVMGDGIILHNQLHPQWNLPARLPAFATLVRRMLAPEAKAPAP